MKFESVAETGQEDGEVRQVGGAVVGVVDLGLVHRPGPLSGFRIITSR
jgi:hypothetical protein